MPETMLSRVDFHMHSVYSDGTDDLGALLDKIKASGIRAFSLTDHDTMDGAVKLEKMISPDSGIRFFRGIEFSTICSLGKIHILGYDYDPRDKTFNALVQESLDLRMQKMNLRLRNLKDRYGITFSDEELAWLWAQPRPGKPHLAQLLIRNALVSSVQEAMDRYLKGISGDTPSFSPERAIDAIRSSGGISIWAHPFWEIKGRFYSKEKVQTQFVRLQNAGIDGIECFYSQYGREQTVFLTSLADRESLLVSGGSDYHGKRKRQTIGELGDGGFLVKEKQLTILEALQKRPRQLS